MIEPNENEHGAAASDDAQTQSADDRPSGKLPRAHLVAVWSGLIVLIVATAALQFGASMMQVQTQSEGPPEADFLFAARFAVATHHIGQWVPAGALDNSSRTVLEDLEKTAGDRPIDRLRVAIVRAELQGAEAGLDALNQINTERGTAEQDAVRRDIAALRAIYTYEDAPPDMADAHNIPEAHPVPVDAQAQQRLVERHAWLGELALSFDQPLSVPRRDRVLHEARRLLWTVMSVAALVGLLLTVGLVLFIIAIVRRAMGKLQTMYERPRGNTLPFLETPVAFLTLFLGGQLMLGGLVALTGLDLMPVFYVLVPAALAWPLFRGVRWWDWRTGLGWMGGRGVLREAGLGLVGYVAGMPIIAAGIMGTVLVSQLTAQEPSHPMIEQVAAGDLGVLLLLLVLAVIWAPLVEESVFRGALYHHLRRGWGVCVSAVLTGVIFAAIHPQGVAGLPALVALGAVLALIREWRGSIVGPMCAHACHNLLTIMFVFQLLR